MSNYQQKGAKRSKKEQMEQNAAKRSKRNKKEQNG